MSSPTTRSSSSSRRIQNNHDIADDDLRTQRHHHHQQQRRSKRKREDATTTTLAADNDNQQHNDHRDVGMCMTVPSSSLNITTPDHDTTVLPKSKRVCRRRVIHEPDNITSTTESASTTSTIGARTCISSSSSSSSATTMSVPVDRETAARIILRAWRRYRWFYPSPLNDQDPITLETWSEIRQQKQPIFVHINRDETTCKNAVYWFKAESLLRTITETGKFVNPITQAEFNNVELRRLERLLKQSENSSSGLTIPNLVQQRRRIVRQVHDRVSDQAMLDYIENTLARLITLALREMSRGNVCKQEYLDTWKPAIMRKYRQLRQYVREHRGVYSLAIEKIVQRGIDQAEKYLTDTEQSTTRGIEMSNRFVLYCTKLQGKYMRLYHHPQACSEKDNVLKEAVREMQDPDELLELEDSVADTDDEIYGLVEEEDENSTDSDTGEDNERPSQTDMDVDDNDNDNTNNDDDDDEEEFGRAMAMLRRDREAVATQLERINAALHHNTRSSNNNNSNTHQNTTTSRTRNMYVADTSTSSEDDELQPPVRRSTRRQTAMRQAPQRTITSHVDDVNLNDESLFFEALRQIEEDAARAISVTAAAFLQLPTGMLVSTRPVQLINPPTLTQHVDNVIPQNSTNSTNHQGRRRPTRSSRPPSTGTGNGSS